MKKYILIDCDTDKTKEIELELEIDEEILKRYFAEDLIWLSWFEKGIVDADEGIDYIRRDVLKYCAFLEEVEDKIADIKIKAC